MMQIRPIQEQDNDWVSSVLKESWGSTTIVTRGKVHKADQLPGFVALIDDQKVGLITYCLDDDCEIVSLDSLVERKGVATALLERTKEVAASEDLRRVWLITTNDNTDALRFYQKRGFVLSALYPNAIEQSRELKPEIPMLGIDGIPIRDEIELEVPMLPTTDALGKLVAGV